MSGGQVVRRALAALWWAATALLFALTARGLVRSVTWYLAVDQYGYLTFAHDLLHGRVFHHWPPLDALAPYLAPRVDALAQSYIWDRGRLYCRYAPGFPMLLAAWMGVFGGDGAHYLTPVAFLVLLGVALAFQRRVFHSRWRATAGVALVVLCPTLITLWAITIVRDLPAHLAGLVGLLVLLPGRRRLGPRRAAAAGLAIGFAGSIRPDAVLYLVPATLLTVLRWWREGRGVGRLGRAAAGGALGVLVGLSPFFAYNWTATGNPLRPTQGVEVEQFFGGTPPQTGDDVGYPSPGWHGGTLEAVQGGGLRLANFPRTFPAEINFLRAAYGDLLLAFAALGAFVALARRRVLFATAVPYVVAALLFFGCWAHPDWRYLAGVFLFVPMLIVEGALGTLDLVRQLARTRAPEVATLAALAVAAAIVAGWLFLPEPVGAVLSKVSAAVGGDLRAAVAGMLLPRPGVAILAVLAAAALPRRRVTAVAAPVLALALVGIAVWKASGPHQPARFQRPAMLLARHTFAGAVPPPAVVITTEDAGRPAENIDYYSGVAHGLYLTDLVRWGIPVPLAAAAFARAGLTPYLFLPDHDPARERILGELERDFATELVADVPAPEALRWFV
ncbi:MAG TPA: hypothetical protein VFD84_13070, partial [Candidatus Binatia bacterium]|nr:hypothetical protein [Candidatus Binatia bacterium]